MSNEPEAQIPIVLKSGGKHPSIPLSKYFVPVSWKRFQLSELLNKVLGYDSQPVPFDFVLFEGKELLRSSLADVLKTHGLSEESSLELEYIESVLPPSFVSSIPYDDWISDVDIASRPQSYLSASYDGSFSIFDVASSSKTTLKPHTQAVLSTCFLKRGDQDLIATASMDSTIKLSTATQTTHELRAHQGPVASIRSASNHLISSGWDGLVALWSVSPAQVIDAALADRTNDADASRAKKRKRKAESDLTLLKPVHRLEGHTGTVARALIDRTDANKAYSAGSDHTVREWNLEYGVETSSRASDKVLLDMDQTASPHLLVTGAMDRTVCFWDTRQDTEAISLTLAGHPSAVSSVSAHPTSPLLVLSACHDAVLRIWDARSPNQALFAIPRHASESQDELPERVRRLKGPEKVLCCDWDGSLVASGGEDKTLQLHRTTV